MAITVKVLNRPIQEASYLRATLGGMARTFKHMVNPHKVTVQYPEMREPVSPRWRGTHRMLTTEDGKAKCVGCGLCPTVCPANCIKLVPGEDEMATGTRWCSRSTNFAASSVATARRCARRRRFTWAVTTRTPSTAAKGSCTISSG